MARRSSRGSPTGSAPDSDATRSRTSARPWSGSLAFGPGWVVFVGRTGDNDLHAHHAIQLCAAARGDVAVRLSDGRRVAAPAVAIGAGMGHRLESTPDLTALLYLDPHSAAGASVAQRIAAVSFRRQGEAGTAELRDLLAGAAPPEALRESLLRLFGGIATDACAGEPRVALATEWIETHVAGGRIRAAEVARAAGLSPSRLAVLFRRETGVAVRAFVLWTRLRRAVEEIARGASLTDAALAAGFADAPHLARTFRRMFGTTLSESIARFDATP